MKQKEAGNNIQKRKINILQEKITEIERFHNMKKSIHQEYIKSLNMFAPNQIASKYPRLREKQKLKESLTCKITEEDINVLFTITD